MCELDGPCLPAGLVLRRVVGRVSGIASHSLALVPNFISNGSRAHRSNGIYRMSQHFRLC
jgi:hypothetical protein